MSTQWWVVVAVVLIVIAVFVYLRSRRTQVSQAQDRRMSLQAQGRAESPAEEISQREDRRLAGMTASGSRAVCSGTGNGSSAPNAPKRPSELTAAMISTAMANADAKRAARSCQWHDGTGGLLRPTQASPSISSSTSRRFRWIGRTGSRSRSTER
jgi:hypothetical protein